MLLFLVVVLCCGLCVGDGDLGYNLNIGYAIDVFANYGDLSQVAQVVSGDYSEEEDDDLPIQPFREKNIRIFANASSEEQNGGSLDAHMSILFCDTLEELLDTYFVDFSIEGTKKPWKAFMGDWRSDEIMRTLGIEYSDDPADSCCFVLAKLSRKHRSVQMNGLTDVMLKDYVRRAIRVLDPGDESDIRSFMKHYGTHYIDSYVTGNFIYQVFKYKKSGYYALKSYMRRGDNGQQDNLRFYFSSFFLKQVGDIRIASGNKTTESWAKLNLRDRTYLYSRPNLLRLYYNPILVKKLSDLLDNQALLALNLKTLKPIFKDETIGDKFSEIVENDLQLWEINA